MLKVPENQRTAGLNERVDELSTRLIIDGVGTVSAADFERLGCTAADMGSLDFEKLARRIAADVTRTPSDAIADLTRVISSGLVELRDLLDKLSSKSQSEESSPATESGASDDGAARSQSLAADESLIREFLTESTEHLCTIESQLLVLENNADAAETLNGIFRAFHTVKGLSGFLEFSELQSLAHEVETLLDLARNLQITVTPSIVDIILESTDVARSELDSIAQKLSGKSAQPSRVTPELLGRIRQAAAPGIEAPNSRPAAIECTLPEAPPDQTAPHVDVLAAAVDMTVHEPPTAPQPTAQERRAADSSSVRIDTAKLDQLMDMVGEMVIAQTLIQHSPVLDSSKDAMLQRNLTQLARIT
ncbi:MAG TPA: Hpt domain-containing protein, partial [Acidobacteriaceae bacterium]|nr:Hpt domain-containing protein [Acidobacteriaceae bacterium]